MSHAVGQQKSALTQFPQMQDERRRDKRREDERSLLHFLGEISQKHAPVFEPSSGINMGCRLPKSQRNIRITELSFVTFDSFYLIMITYFSCSISFLLFLFYFPMLGSSASDFPYLFFYCLLNNKWHQDDVFLRDTWRPWTVFAAIEAEKSVLKVITGMSQLI